MAAVEFTVADSEAMEALGLRLARLLRAGDLVVLTGPLGAGKTTLTRGIGRGLGVRGQVASPTFVLARTHPALTPDGVPLVHVDAYRLGSAAELDDLDLDYAGSVVVVEWGSGLLDGVADSWLDVRIARPVGGEDAAGLRDDATHGAGVAGAGAAGAAGGDATGAAGAGAAGAAGGDGAGGDVGDEPRTVVLEAHGPRWAGLDLRRA